MLKLRTRQIIHTQGICLVLNSTFSGWHLTALVFFVIFFFSVDGPDVVFCFDIINYILDGCHRRKHRMVLIVVSVHSRPADEEQIIKFIREIANDVEMLVRTKIAGISLWHPITTASRTSCLSRMPILTISSIANWMNSLSGVFHSRSTFIAEILQANPDVIFVLDHIGTPVIKNLEATDLDVGFLNINPVVRNDIIDCFYFGIVS